LASIIEKPSVMLLSRAARALLLIPGLAYT